MQEYKLFLGLLSLFFSAHCTMQCMDHSQTWPRQSDAPSPLQFATQLRELNKQYNLGIPSYRLRSMTFCNDILQRCQQNNLLFALQTHATDQHIERLKTIIASYQQ